MYPDGSVAIQSDKMPPVWSTRNAKNPCPEPSVSSANPISIISTPGASVASIEVVMSGTTPAVENAAHVARIERSESAVADVVEETGVSGGDVRNISTSELAQAEV